jgi:hypothetical protein
MIGNPYSNGQEIPDGLLVQGVQNLAIGFYFRQG